MVHPGNKKLLRKELIDRRSKVAPKHRATASEVITDRIINKFDLNAFKSVHTYLSKDNEISTVVLLNRIWKHYPKVRTYVPVITKQNYLEHYEVTVESKFIIDKYGIRNPVNGLEKENTEFDIIFFPVVAFDNIGNRIGMGGGYYDRFLSSLSDKSIKVGLAYDFQKVEVIKPEGHDIRLDYCVTEEGIYDFRNK